MTSFALDCIQIWVEVNMVVSDCYRAPRGGKSILKVISENRDFCQVWTRNREIGLGLDFKELVQLLAMVPKRLQSLAMVFPGFVCHQRSVWKPQIIIDHLVTNPLFVWSRKSTLALVNHRLSGIVTDWDKIC